MHWITKGLLVSLAVALVANVLYAIFHRRPDPAQLPYIDVRETNLTPGDLILCSGMTVPNMIFKSIYWSPWTHAAIVIGTDTVMHCHPSIGCGVQRLQDFLNGYNGYVAVRRLKREYWEQFQREFDHNRVLFDSVRFGFLFPEPMARTVTCLLSRHLGIDVHDTPTPEERAKKRLNCTQFVDLVYSVCLPLPIDKLTEPKTHCHPADFTMNTHPLFEQGIQLIKKY